MDHKKRKPLKSSGKQSRAKSPEKQSHLRQAGEPETSLRQARKAGSAGLTFDHAHLISQDPHAAASWYVEMLGGVVIKSADTLGAPQIHVSFGNARIIIRGRRPAELAAAKTGLLWGIDHFGMQVSGDFDAFCAALRGKGVRFSMDPIDFNPTTRIAYIEAPDGIDIELLARKE